MYGKLYIFKIIKMELFIAGFLYDLSSNLFMHWRTSSPKKVHDTMLLASNLRFWASTDSDVLPTSTVSL